ncbi:hypothetical protein BDA96_10G317100 [Sorghum bicolor]|uniref:Uncharacterized protein n=1 Tax=Sorghum bicolor TaxID=4558 RepID=A0A921U2V6_SORBI|nr:hypothetical protein BDA96_10G317100 [Sorghum bicolor]
MPSPSSFFFGNFVSRHSFPRGQSIPRQTARRRLPFTNSRAKQPRSTDRELRSSSFPFAVPIALPISRSVSSRSPYQFVVCWPSIRRRTGSPLAPVPISIRSCSPSVSGRRHQFVVKAGRRHQSSRCSSRAAEFREANMGSRVPENGSSRITQRIAKLAKEDAQCFSYRAKWWRREGKSREGKKKAREVEPRIP